MTGWRLGYAAAPADVLEAMMKVHQYVMMSAPTTAQYAGARGAAQRRGGRARHGRGVRPAASTDRARLQRHRAQAASSRAAPSTPSRPSRVTGLSDEAFAEELLMEEKVAVVPGSAFGECGVGHVRACYAQSYELIEQALERIRRFVDRHRR